MADHRQVGPGEGRLAADRIGMGALQQRAGTVPSGGRLRRLRLDGSDNGHGGCGDGCGDGVGAGGEQAHPNGGVNQAADRGQGDQVRERQQRRRPGQPAPRGQDRDHPQQRHDHGVAPERPGEQPERVQERVDREVLVAQPVA